MKIAVKGGFGEGADSEWTPELFPDRNGFYDRCFVVKRNVWGKYFVEELRVLELCFSNGIWSWLMSDNNIYGSNQYGVTVFKQDDLQTALEICEDKQRKAKVKVKRLKENWTL